MVTLLHFGWRVASKIVINQSPLRFALTVATTLMHEGFKVKVDTWIGKQKKRKKSKFIGRVGLTLMKTICAKRRKNATFSEVRDVVALDAGMKYKELAQLRLKVARASFEAAEVELKAAERGMKEAEKYVISLVHYKNTGKQTHNDDIISDVMFVEHASENEGGKRERRIKKEVAQVVRDDRIVVSG